MPQDQAEDKFKVLLMINKRGFRHTEAERNFIASQVNWCYDAIAAQAVRFTRQLMETAQSFSHPKNSKDGNKLKQTETLIMLTREANGATSVTERMICDNEMSIDVAGISSSERLELANILDGTVKSSSAEDLTAYLKAISEYESSQVALSFGCTAGHFIAAVARHLERYAEHIVPLFLENSNDENGMKFRMVVAPKNAETNYVFRITLNTGLK